MEDVKMFHIVIKIVNLKIEMIIKLSVLKISIQILIYILFIVDIFFVKFFYNIQQVF